MHTSLLCRVNATTGRWIHSYRHSCRKYGDIENPTSGTASIPQYVYTQHRWDHCLQRLFLTFVVILWFLSLSISVKVPKALSEHQMGPAHNTFFHLNGKWTNVPTLTSDPVFIWMQGWFSLNSFCLCILHFLFVLNFYNLLIVIWNPPKCIKTHKINMHALICTSFWHEFCVRFNMFVCWNICRILKGCL